MERTKYLSPVEVDRLRTVTQAGAIIALASGHAIAITRWAIVDTALSTGLRVGELASLDTQAIDWRRSGLTVTRLKKKTPKPELIPLGKPLMDHLREYAAWLATPGPLFRSNGRRLTRRALQYHWTSAVTGAGLEACGIHAARHTLATALLRETGNLRAVQLALGHSSPVTTANMYADISFEDRLEALNRLYQSEPESPAK